ncbi:MAG: hypothetical protein KKD77_23770 [Gammaproteobacteria bacterium]|nr:hypothetical protein [Gammaproteobacteria bacterium]
MAGVKKLRKILLGREQTAGTEANASTYWRGTGTIQENITVEFPEEDVGYLSGLNRTYIPKTEALLELDETPATFEGVLHLLEMGIETVTTATTGGGVQYVYDFPTTAANTIKTYTVEGGDDQQETQFLYGFCQSFSLSGSAGEAVMMAGSIVGRQVATGTFTTNPTMPSQDEILFGKGVLYIDTAGGTQGLTPQTTTFLSFGLEVDTGWRATYTGDGQIYFTFAKNIGPEITLNLEFEHDAFSVAQLAAWRAETAQLIRVQFTGATLTTTGTTYTAKTLRIDLAGSWESFDKLGERDGNDVVAGTFRARYDTTASKFATITDVCNLTAVP